MVATHRTLHALSMSLVVAAVVVLLLPSAVATGSVADASARVDVRSLSVPWVISKPPIDAPVEAAVAAPLPPSTASAAVPVMSFEGLSFGANGNLTNRYSPPDVQVATGPNHVVEMVNAIGRISTRAGVAVQTFALSSFFGATSTDFLSDPKVRFDNATGRWFATLTDVTTSSILLAVSTSDDPTGAWTQYSFLASAGCADQPLLGMSDDKVVLSANDFTSCTSRPKYAGVEFWVINKADLVGGASARFTTFGPNNALFSLQPVHSLSSTSTQYLVSAGFGPASTLTLYAVTGVPPGSVSVTPASLPIRTTAVPPNAPQLGSKYTLDTGDARVQDALFDHDRLWLALAHGCVPAGDTGTRACVRLIEVDTTNTAILQDFDLGLAGKHLLYPALRTDGQGHLLVVFGFSSGNDYPGIMTAVRAEADPPNTIGGPVLLRAGTGPEATGCSTTTCRYGDYFGAAQDPSDPGIVWVAAEYGTPGGWATYIAAMSATVRLTMSYSVSGGGSGYEPPILTYIRSGATVTASLTSSSVAYTVDAGTTWSVTPVLAGSTATERWATDREVSGTATAPASIAFTYAHQYAATFEYRVVGGGSGYAPPSVAFQQFAATVTDVANVAAWVDAGSPYSYPASLDGSKDTERWIADPQATGGTVSGPEVIEVPYTHQAYVTMDAQGPPGASLSPGTDWYDVGVSLSLSVSAPSGWAVGTWMGVGPGAYSGTDATPSVVVVGPLSETAVLYPGLTIMAGSGGSVSYSFDGGSGSVAGGSSRTIYVAPGTEVTLVEVPSSAFDFAGWSGASTGSASNVTTTVNGPTQVAANFSLTQTAAFALYSAFGVMVVIAALVIVALVRRRRRTPPPPPPDDDVPPPDEVLPPPPPP